MNILGVRIDNLTKQEILEKIEFFLTENQSSTIPDEKVLDKFHQVATVNPEFILAAQKNEKFREILNATALNVADGVGVWYAFIRNFAYLKARMTGADLLFVVLQKAEKLQLPVFLAIKKDGLSSLAEIEAVLRKKYPQLKIGGQEYVVGSRYELSVVGYQLLLCNFGAPEQELFISSVKNDTIRLAMGVGGAFDFATGKLKRAPKFMRYLGLEWLWRLIQQPRRYRRIWRAVVIFPLKVLFNLK